jgi:probable HAF family extracellular repeat protein
MGVAATIALTVASSSARAQQACSPVAIPPVTGDDAMYVSGLNNWGQIIGFSYAQDANGVAHGFVWSRNRTRRLEPLLAGEHTLPYAINDLGLVVGEAGDDTGFQPVLWTQTGVKRLRGQAGDRPEAINVRGQIAGSRGGTCLLWPSAHAEPLVIGNLGGAFCSVRGINERGEVVGISLNAAQQPTGFLWFDGVMTPVGDLTFPDGSPADEQSSSLLAINEWGLAVGYSGPFLDVLTWRRRAGGELLTAYAGVGAFAVSDLSTIFALRASNETLVLFTPNGEATEKGSLPGGVNGQQLFANNLFQLAWQTSDLRGQFCQLSPW